MNSEKVLLLYLRRIIGYSFMLVVPLCIGFAATGIKFPGYMNSLSGTYWTCSREIFVLLLGMSGIFLCLYKGYDIWDRIINILTGLSLLALIIFPTFNPVIDASNPRVDYNIFPFLDQNISFIIHSVAAAVATVCFIINLLFLFTQHGGEITNKKKIRNIIYKVCGYTVLGIFTISNIFFALDKTGHIPTDFPVCIITICQSLELLAVGFAWTVKGESLGFFNDER